jgi:hypothetical protein
VAISLDWHGDWADLAIIDWYIATVCKTVTCHRAVARCTWFWFVFRCPRGVIARASGATTIPTFVYWHALKKI